MRITISVNKFVRVYLLAGIAIILISNFVFLGIRKSLAYGNCDYSEGSYGVDCDEVAPTGSILINNGVATTTSRSVTLKINAIDDSGIVSQMLISENSSFIGASWEAYATSKVFSLSGEFGMKTVYIKFKDSVENVSSTYFDKIEYVSSAAGGISEETIVKEVEDAETEEPIGPSEPTEGKVYYKLKLVDKDGNPLKGAEVTISELGIQAITDDNGIINLGFVEKKDYEVVVENNGEKYTQILSLNNDEATAVLKLGAKEDKGNNTLLIVGILGFFILIGGGIGYILLQKDSFSDTNPPSRIRTNKSSNILKTRVVH